MHRASVHRSSTRAKLALLRRMSSSSLPQRGARFSACTTVVSRFCPAPWGTSNHALPPHCAYTSGRGGRQPLRLAHESVRALGAYGREDKHTPPQRAVAAAAGWTGGAAWGRVRRRGVLRGTAFAWAAWEGSRGAPQTAWCSAVRAATGPRGASKRDAAGPSSIYPIRRELRALIYGAIVD
jgi:hypothetical protein